MKLYTRKQIDRLIDRNSEVVESEQLVNNPIVSVCLATYQHERFLEQAIESVLNQKTEFDFELVIGEDHSSDSTRAIAKRYQARFPQKIRLHLSTHRLGKYTNSGLFNHLRNLNNCRGKYVAMLEAMIIGHAITSCSDKSIIWNPTRRPPVVFMTTLPLTVKARLSKAFFAARTKSVISNPIASSYAPVTRLPV